MIFVSTSVGSSGAEKSLPKHEFSFEFFLKFWFFTVGFCKKNPMKAQKFGIFAFKTLIFSLVFGLV